MYRIPEGNLFPANGSRGRPEIFVMGCRNPFRYNKNFHGEPCQLVAAALQLAGDAGPREYPLRHRLISLPRVRS